MSTLHTQREANAKSHTHQFEFSYTAMVRSSYTRKSEFLTGKFQGEIRNINLEIRKNLTDPPLSKLEKTGTPGWTEVGSVRFYRLFPVEIPTSEHNWNAP